MVGALLAVVFTVAACLVLFSVGYSAGRRRGG